MNSKRIDFTQLGGFGLNQDALDFSQIGNHAGFEALAKAMGDKIILTGVEQQGAVMTDGYVVINGELLPFVGGAIADKVWIETLQDVELFGDSSIKTVYFTRRARMGNLGDYDLSDFRRLKTDQTNIDDGDIIASARAVKKLNDSILAIVGFENGIILKGCEVSNVVAGALQIAPGIISIDNSIVSSVAYNGVYPAYLKPDGTYATAQPVGSFIKFDPNTSQRYADVFKRATTSVGEVKMFKALSDRFDANGVGKWEMLGFKICDDLQGRVPLGYDRRVSDPGDNVWDYNYTNPGNVGGEKKHKLTIDEMPKHSHNVPAKASGPTGAGAIVDGNNDGQGTRVVSETAGNDQPHNNLQPYRVIVFVERT